MLCFAPSISALATFIIIRSLAFETSCGKLVLMFIRLKISSFLKCCLLVTCKICLKFAMSHAFSCRVSVVVVVHAAAPYKKTLRIIAL